METVRFGGRTFPLAADFTVPVAVLLARNNPKKYELTRLLRPEKYAETARIARLQPYDPNKTVILVVHGLMDTPATWTPMINTLRGDEEIRRNYQFWFFSYPSGYPYPYSAAILRRELDAIEQKFRLRKPMVVMGHSMGGCISRLLITDTGDKLWMEIFGKSAGRGESQARTQATVYGNAHLQAPAGNWQGRYSSPRHCAGVILPRIASGGSVQVSSGCLLPCWVLAVTHSAS